MPAAGAAQSAYCDELWFTRNLIFDRAGQCFATPLGAAVFDNAGCIQGAEIGPQDAQIVAMIAAVERENTCAVDTDRTALPDAQALDFYRQFDTVPPRAMYESACIGYRGAPIALRAGPDAGAAVTGRVRAGADIAFAHDPVEDWIFATVEAAEIGGWMPRDQALSCEMYAG